MTRAGVLGALTSEAPRPAWLRDRPWAGWAAVASVCLGAFMGQLDASIVTLTYPSLQDEFGVSLGSVEWVSLSYLVVLAALLVPVGRWADARGRKLLYLYGFVVFTLASAGCALAPSLGWLVAARAVQAVGAALLQANSVALVTTSVPRASVRNALGVQAAAQALGLALGPTVGGVLVDTAGWRSVFWVNVPVGIVAVVAGRVLLPRTRQHAARTGRDPGGFVLLALTAVSALLVLSALGGLPLPGDGVTVVALALVALLAGAGLVAVERRVAAPLLEPALVATPGVTPGLVGALAAYLVIFGPLVLVPTVLTTWGVSTSVGGLVLTCLPLGFALAAVGGSALPRSLDNRARVLVGGGLAVPVLAALAALWRHPGAVAALLLALGLCLGLAVPANNASVMGAVPTSAAAVTGGLVNVARALGTSLGVALTALGLHLAPHLHLEGPTLVLGMLLVAAVVLTLSALGRHSGHPSGAGGPA
ncbi:MAG: MFS transporter [Motilibacteraceae bacterium]